MFAFAVMQPSVCYSYVKSIAIPTTSFIYNVGQLSTGKPVPLWEKKKKKKLCMTSVFENYKKKNFYNFVEDIW